MINPTLSLREGAAARGEFRIDGVDVVRTLRDLTALELGGGEKRPELELRRLSLRQELPADVLRIHDVLVREGKTSVAPRFANTCTECSGVVAVGRDANRLAKIFVQCPHCGTLLYG